MSLNSVQAEAHGPTPDQERRRRIEAALRAMSETMTHVERPPRPATKRSKRKVKPYAQLSDLQRELLAVLVGVEVEMQNDPERADRLKRVGVPWQPLILAERLERHTASLVRALGAMEKRQLVYCRKEGEGRGKRYRHIRLTDQARAIGLRQQQYGMSHDQMQRLRHTAQLVADQSNELTVSTSESDNC